MKRNRQPHQARRTTQKRLAAVLGPIATDWSRLPAFMVAGQGPNHATTVFRPSAAGMTRTLNSGPTANPVNLTA